MAVNNVEFHFESFTENVIFHFNRFATFPTKCDTLKKRERERERCLRWLIPFAFRMKSENAIWRFAFGDFVATEIISRRANDKTIHSNYEHLFVIAKSIYFSPFPVAWVVRHHLKLNQERIYFNTSFQWSLLPFQWTTKSVVVLIADVLEIDSKRRCRRFNMQSLTTPSSKFILKMGNIWKNVLESRENKKNEENRAKQKIRVFFFHAGRRLQIVKCVHLSVFIVFRC